MVIINKIKSIKINEEIIFIKGAETNEKGTEKGTEKSQWGK